jgi:NADPH:quinone reductase
VLIKVVVSGSNPKDWYAPKFFNKPHNTGDDIAGIVDKVGDRVYEFRPGDRVAAFHPMGTPHGSFAQYAIALAATTFHIPKTTSFEEAAAVPLTAMTAAVALYRRVGLPQPTSPAPKGAKTPLIVYGASSAVGVYTIQLARRSNIHPLLCVAGRACPYVETLIDRNAGDTVVDYRAGTSAIVEGLQAATGKDVKVYHAFDAVAANGSQKNFIPILGTGGKATFVSPAPLEDESFPEGIEKTWTFVGDVHKEEDESARDFGFLYSRLFGRGMQEGWLKPQRQEVVPGGLDGVQTGLSKLKAGQASAVKYVFRIAAMEGGDQ